MAKGGLSLSVGFTIGEPIIIVADDEADYQKQKDAIVKLLNGKQFIESRNDVGIIQPLYFHSAEPVPDVSTGERYEANAQVTETLSRLMAIAIAGK